MVSTRNRRFRVPWRFPVALVLKSLTSIKARCSTIKCQSSRTPTTSNNKQNPTSNKQQQQQQQQGTNKNRDPVPTLSFLLSLQFVKTKTGAPPVVLDPPQQQQPPPPTTTTPPPPQQHHEYLCIFDVYLCIFVHILCICATQLMGWGVDDDFPCTCSHVCYATDGVGCGW